VIDVENHDTLPICVNFLHIILIALSWCIITGTTLRSMGWHLCGVKSGGFEHPYSLA